MITSQKLKTTLLKNKIQLNAFGRSYWLYLTIHESGSIQSRGQDFAGTLQKGAGEGGDSGNTAGWWRQGHCPESSVRQMTSAVPIRQLVTDRRKTHLQESGNS